MSKNNDLWLERAAYIEKLEAELAAAKERERTNDILLEQQGDKLAALNDELASAREEIELNEINLGLAVDYQKQLISDSHVERTELKRQLAARDLMIKQMRSVMCRLADHDQDCTVFDLDDQDRHLPCSCGLSKALALQPSTEALDAYVQKAVEQEREACAALCESRLDYGEPDSWITGWNDANYGAAAAIRARKS